MFADVRERIGGAKWGQTERLRLLAERVFQRGDIALAAHFRHETPARFQVSKHAFDKPLRLGNPMQNRVGENGIEAFGKAQSRASTCLLLRLGVRKMKHGSKSPVKSLESRRALLGLARTLKYPTPETWAYREARRGGAERKSSKRVCWEVNSSPILTVEGKMLPR